MGLSPKPAENDFKMSTAAWSALSGEGAWWIPDVTSNGPKYPLNATKDQVASPVMLTPPSSKTLRGNGKEEGNED